MKTLHVGDTIMVERNDGTRRFVEKTITGESRTHWHVGEPWEGLKFRKAVEFPGPGRESCRTCKVGGYRVAAFLDVDDWREWQWGEENRRRIVAGVERCDAATLRKIDALIANASTKAPSNG